MLYNPDKHIVIRVCPMYKNRIACDRLDGGTVEEIAHVDTMNIHKAFAWLANQNKIEPVGWYEVEHISDPMETYYYGNSR